MIVYSGCRSESSHHIHPNGQMGRWEIVRF
jgi:hypothetical protein